MASRDCTNDLLGRVVQFEYLDFRSYWVKMSDKAMKAVGRRRSSAKPFPAYQLMIAKSNLEDVIKREKQHSWRIIKCGRFACAENLSPVWRGAYFWDGGTNAGAVQESDINKVKDSKKFHFAFLCNSCSTFSYCNIQSIETEKIFYAKKNHYIRSHSNDKKYSRYNFYIKASETKDDMYYEVDTILNCHSSQYFPGVIKYIYGILKQDKSGKLVGVGVSLGLIGEIVEGLEVSAGVTFKKHWTKEKLHQLTKRKEITIGGKDGVNITPGYYLSVTIPIAYYGEYVIKGNEYNVTMPKCNTGRSRFTRLMRV